MEWANIILQGVLVGGLYAMFAAGLSLIFGVMRLVNIAHGDLIVMSAYVALAVTQTQSQLATATTESSTGQYADLGLLGVPFADRLLEPVC